VTETSQHHSKKAPVVVHDFAALDVAWADYIEQGALADGGAAYAKRWQVWLAHCTEEGVDPWDAPGSAFESLWLRRREADGALVSPNFIEGISVAVSHFYRQKGLTPANKRPENCGRWRELRRGRRKTASQNRDLEKSVVPMMRTDAQTLMSAPMPALRTVRRAALLLLLDGFAPGVIDALTLNAVIATPSVSAGVVVRGQHVACDHEERVRGVPFDCTSCAVRAAIVEIGEGEPFRTGLVNAMSQLRARFRCLAGKGEPWGPREGLTVWEQAGLRRALVLSTAVAPRDGYRWVRARAWVGVAWSCGLRMKADTLHLQRGDAAPDAAGRGWSVRLAATKDDQPGAKNVVRAFSWDSADGQVASAIAEFACVRDALIGSEGRLFNLNAVERGTSTDRGNARADLDLLARLAGIAPVFSSYSTRKGFSAQALADGWTEDQIQEGLRHLHLTTTITHYVPKTGVRKVAGRFAGRVAGIREAR